MGIPSQCTIGHKKIPANQFKDRSVRTRKYSHLRRNTTQKTTFLYDATFFITLENARHPLVLFHKQKADSLCVFQHENSLETFPLACNLLLAPLIVPLTTLSFGNLH